MAENLDYKPKYLMVMEHLKEKIINGRYKQGEALPPQRVLIKKYGVALGTIRQSLSKLASEGWIRPELGRGCFVQIQVPQKNNTIKNSEQKRSQLGFVWWYDIASEPLSRTYVCIMHAASQEAKKCRTELIYAQFNPKSDEDNERLAEFVKKFDGVIITGKVDALMLRDIVGTDSNIVIAGWTLKQEGREYFSNISSDIYSAGYLAVQHLISHGHNKLALVNKSGSMHFSEIQRGYEHACRESKLQYTRTFIMDDVTNEVKMDIYQKINEVADKIARCPEITGIVVAGEVLSEAMIYQLNNRGCHIPADKSIISIGGIPRGEMELKNITQVRMHSEQMGIECVRCLLNNAKQVVHKFLPVNIERGETVLSLNQTVKDSKAVIERKLRHKNHVFVQMFNKATLKKKFLESSE